MAYQKKNDIKLGRRKRKEYYISIPTRNGGRVQRSSRTSKKKLAECYEAMFAVLSPRSEQDRVLIERVIAGTLRVEELYHNYTGETLQKLTPRPVDDAGASSDPDPDPDLDSYAKEWAENICNFVAANTAVSYVAAVRSFIPAGTVFPLPQLTGAGVSKWVSTMKGAASTKHHRLSGLKHFIAFLIEREVVKTDPTSGMKRPKGLVVRDKHMEIADVLILANAMPSPYKELTIFIHGTGAEVTPAIKTTVGDVKASKREVWVNGTKNSYRQRHVRVAERAWPTTEDLIAGKADEELLFPDIGKAKDLWTVHKETLTRLIDEGLLSKTHIGYTPRDSRHTFAIRLVKAGVPLQVVARALGHKDTRMVSKVYGKYQPSHQERDHWERHTVKFVKNQEREIRRRTLRNDSRARSDSATSKDAHGKP